MRPLITICIPIYNSNIDYLRTAIASVKNQSLTMWELILVDGNHEPDLNACNLLNEFNDKRMHYYKNNGDKSIANNWNCALNQASTELVTLLHDDDALRANYVEEMIKLSTEYPNSNAYFCDVKLINAKNKLTFTFADFIKNLISGRTKKLHIKGDRGLSNLLKGCYIYCPTVCYRKSNLPRELFNLNWKMVADLQCYADILINGGKITGTNQKLYDYRRHPHNETNKLTATMVRFDEEILLYNKLFEKATYLNWEKTKYIAQNKTIIKFHLIYLIVKSLVSIDFVKFKKLFLYFLSIDK